MTDDELIYATSEVIAQLEEYREMILARYRGKVAKAYGDKLFQIETTDYSHGHVRLCGSILKKDGTAHARSGYGVRIHDIEFV